jgi:hypothetical protein
MPTLTIRNVPQEVFERLKDRASRQGRSMEQELREILGYHMISRDELIDRIQMQWRHLPDPPSAEEVGGWIQAGRRGRE